MDRELERDFTAFVQVRSSSLFRTAMALTGHREQAQDLLQTALANAARHWHRVRDGHPEAYIRRSMYLQSISWWRRRSRAREVVTAEVPERATGSGAPDSVDLRLALVAALRRLGPRQRGVIVLRYLEDLPDEQIAQILGCRQSTVRSQIARALERLRQLCPELALTEQEILR
jgi:RNA polymerase sigma-70 factor (sigma-E family)